MANYKKIFMKHMDSKCVRYTDVDDKVVRVAYNGENIESVAVYVSFDSKGEGKVQLSCWDIANFKGKLAQGLIICNTLNDQYRWVKFYLDDDHDVVCECDAYINDLTCGSICLALVNAIVSIVDDSYPSIANALRS